METFAERIRERARELGLSDAEVARRAGVERAPVRLLCDGGARAEPGNPRSDLRGPSCYPERFAPTGRQAGRPIGPRSVACQDQRRDGQPQPHRT